MRLLEEKVDNVILLMGGMKSKDKDKITERLRNIAQEESLVLVAVGKYVGEGFNLFCRLISIFKVTFLYGLIGG